MKITFTVPGEPISQPRQRHRVIPGQRFAHNYTPKNSPVNEYKAAIRILASESCHEPTDRPITMTISCKFSRPKSHYRTGKHSAELRPDIPCWHTSKPDAENIAKAVMDALTGIAYKDDKQVCCLTIHKMYNVTPVTEITLATL